jgi:hypothetical protein
VSSEARTKLLHRLVEAVQSQDQSLLIDVLSADSTWTSDGGGKTKAAKKVISGAEHVARFAVGVFHRYLGQMQFRGPADLGDQHPHRRAPDPRRVQHPESRQAAGLRAGRRALIRLSQPHAPDRLPGDIE